MVAALVGVFCGVLYVTAQGCPQDPAPAQVGKAPACVGWVQCSDGPAHCVAWDDGTISSRVIDCTEIGPLGPRQTITVPM